MAKNDYPAIAESGRMLLLAMAAAMVAIVLGVVYVDLREARTNSRGYSQILRVIRDVDFAIRSATTQRGDNR